MRKRGASFKYKSRAPVVFGVARSDSIDLQAQPHAALDRCLGGLGDSQDIATLATRVNWAQALSGFHEPDHSFESLDAAVDSVASMIKRLNQTGKVGLSGDERRAIGNALNVADFLQGISTRRQLRDALLSVERSLHGIKPGQVAELKR